MNDPPKTICDPFNPMAKHNYRGRIWRFVGGSRYIQIHKILSRGSVLLRQKSADEYIIAVCINALTSACVLFPLYFNKGFSFPAPVLMLKEAMPSRADPLTLSNDPPR
jgi:hypothetical protein